MCAAVQLKFELKKSMEMLSQESGYLADCIDKTFDSLLTKIEVFLDVFDHWASRFPLWRFFLDSKYKLH